MVTFFLIQNTFTKYYGRKYNILKILPTLLNRKVPMRKKFFFYLLKH